jgi:hypothetical protein
LTEPAPRPVERGPLHPVTRIGRVLQQIQSFTTLHASELEGVAAELEAAGQDELAARLRIFQGLHSQEAGLILDELVDVQAELDREPALPSLPLGPSIPTAPQLPLPQAGEGEPRGPSDINPARADPAVNSPKRARWLVEQAHLAEEARRPRSRRKLFRPG